MSAMGRFGVMFAAALVVAGLYLESTTVIVIATIAAMASVVNWVRWTAPHDHWRALRRRRPWDP